MRLQKPAPTVRAEAKSGIGVPGRAKVSVPVRRKDEHSPGAPVSISPSERNQWIAQAAYFRAEKRAFAPGGELRDWLEAEAEVERRLKS